VRAKDEVAKELQSLGDALDHLDQKSGSPPADVVK
jgi:hypothetical protein